MEIISTKDQVNLVQLKLNNYRDAGVQVVWLIFPWLEQVHIYQGNDLKRMIICEGDDKCSAAPALPVFELRAADVFFKSPLP